MEEKLMYLKEYSNSLRIVPQDEINNINIEAIPITWREIFSETNIKRRIELILDLWSKYVGSELRNTISYLHDYLDNIELIEVDNVFSILYTVKNSKGKIMYYEGRNPKETTKNEELEEAWGHIPTSVRSFYGNVHNGFFYFASESMGLVPLESVTYLGDEDLEWSVIDELEEPVQINLETSFGFFSNGMGSYVAIDYTNCNNNNSTFWSSKMKPKYNINFWSYVDEWIVIGFEG
ncbi:SMI1/KNR4 family protein [Paenibacillus sp. BAC0078]